jgi:hypothetical protein
MLKNYQGSLSFRLTRLEKVGALSGDPTALASNLISVTQVHNPWNKSVLRGVRAPGTGVPYRIMLGTMKHEGGKDFCVIYRKNPVLILEFQNEKYVRWVIPDNASNRAVIEGIGIKLNT